MPKRKKTTDTTAPVELPPVTADDRDNLPRIAAMFQSIQRDRVGLERALETRGHPDPHADRILDQFRRLEAATVDYVTAHCEVSPIYPWLREVKGIGPRLAGMLVGLIDIRKANTVSALWRYAGLGVVCGFVITPRRRALKKGDVEGADAVEAVRGKECRRTFGPNGECPEHGKQPGISEQRRKGIDLAFNIKLKKTCFLIARSFIMLRIEPYNGIYEEAKVYYVTHRPTWDKGRQDLAARRKMVKVFLSHLWKAWREAEGLPVGEPYILAKGKDDQGIPHTHYIPPAA